MDMDIKPLVTVLMPVFNGEKYIYEAIESILNQTFRNFEFIIIDDGSTDQTSTIIKSFTDPRIRLVQNTENIGVSKSSNKGLALAEGIYIARLDADDVSLPERLSKQVEYLEHHPNIGVLGTSLQIIDAHNNKSNTLLLPTQHNVLKWCLCFINSIAHSTVMMRREVVEQVHGYNADMVLAEDYDLWRRLSCITQLSNLHDIYVLYRVHDANATNLHSLKMRENSVQISTKMISDILKEEVPISTVKLLWDYKVHTLTEVHAATRIIFKLLKTISSEKELSRIEKKIISRDAASRLFRLVRPKLQNISVWGVIVRICYLNPLFLILVAQKKVSRIFKN